MHRTKLTLANICGGAVQEKIDRAMEKVARNILDPNTSNKEKRVITLKITFSPKEDDIENIHVNAEVYTKLSMENGVSTDMFMSTDIGTNAVQIMEHRRGEIRGQLDFSDLEGFAEIEETMPARLNMETGELEEPEPGTVLDFRKKKA